MNTGSNTKLPSTRKPLLMPTTNPGLVVLRLENIDAAKELTELGENLKSLGLYGRNKRRVQCHSRWINGKTEECHIAFFAPLPAAPSEAYAEAEARRFEVLIAANNLSPYLVTALGYVVSVATLAERAGEVELEHIAGVIYRATPQVEFTLHQVILKPDIDVAQAIPYFVRQILSALSQLHERGIVLRNLDATRVIIFRQQDRTLCGKVMDVSEARYYHASLEAPARLRRLAHLPAYPAPEQLDDPESLIAQSPAVDCYAIAALCLDGVCVNGTHDGAPLPEKLAELLTTQTGKPPPPRLRFDDVKAMPHGFRRWWLDHQISQDGDYAGLARIARGALTETAAQRMSVVDMLTTMRDLQTLSIPLAVGHAKVGTLLKRTADGTWKQRLLKLNRETLTLSAEDAMKSVGIERVRAVWLLEPADVEERAGCFCIVWAQPNSPCAYFQAGTIDEAASWVRAFERELTAVRALRDTFNTLSGLLGTRDTNAPTPYTVKSEVGSGVSGTALLLRRTSDGCNVIGKIIDLYSLCEAKKKYARNEIRCLESCDHFAIIRLIDFVETPDHSRLLLLMECADNGNLECQINQRALRNYYFAEHEVAFLFLQIVLAVDYMHRLGIMHRDIKSANVFLMTFGIVKIGDLGFSQVYMDTVSGDVGRPFRTTPYYLAPELWKGHRYSKKADVWSLGVLLYEMAFLKRPFAEGFTKELGNAEYEPLPHGFSSDLRDLVHSMLRSDPNARPTTSCVLAKPYMRKVAQDFQDAITQCAQFPVAEKTKILSALSDAQQTLIAASLTPAFSDSAPAIQHLSSRPTEQAHAQAPLTIRSDRSDPTPGHGNALPPSGNAAGVENGEYAIETPTVLGEGDCAPESAALHSLTPNCSAK